MGAEVRGRVVDVLRRAYGVEVHRDDTKVDEASHELDALACTAATQGHLTIATNPGPGIAWLPQILGKIRDDRPDVTVRVLTRSSREVRDLLAARAFDLGIAGAPFDRNDAVVHHNRFECVVLRAGDAVAKERVNTPKRLDGHPMVGLVPEHGTTAPIARAFEATGADPRSAVGCEYFATALKLVRYGVGVCLRDPIRAALTIEVGRIPSMMKVV